MLVLYKRTARDAEVKVAYCIKVEERVAQILVSIIDAENNVEFINRA